MCVCVCVRASRCATECNCLCVCVSSHFFLVYMRIIVNIMRTMLYISIACISCYTKTLAGSLLYSHCSAAIVASTAAADISGCFFFLFIFCFLFKKMKKKMKVFETLATTTSTKWVCVCVFATEKEEGVKEWKTKKEKIIQNTVCFIVIYLYICEAHKCACAFVFEFVHIAVSLSFSHIFVLCWVSSE